MRTRSSGMLTIAAIICLLLVTKSWAAGPPPPPAPATLWNFLGIPQSIHKVQDARINRNGDNPDRERTPALKQIADPANLDSPSPAIKMAAKIKADQDSAPQKIKAIKYLATVGCGCYPGVKDALLASLDDCTEEVRYEAAVAFCRAAGNPCKNCEKNGCCDATVMNKLHDMAYGQDNKCCYKEASERVRAAATNALNACHRMHPQGAQPSPAPQEGKKELPQEPLLPKAAPKEVPLDLPPEAPMPAPPQDPKTSSGSATGSVSVIGVGFTHGSSAAADNSQVGPATIVAAGYRGPACQQPDCGPGAYVPPGSRPATGAQSPATGQEAGAQSQGSAAEAGTQPSGVGAAGEAAPSLNALAGNFGAAPGPLSAAPNMIGDFCSSGGNIILLQRSVNSDFGFVVSGSPSIAIAGGDRVFKFAENDNPIPRDRVFFDYNHYVNAITDARSNSGNLDRFTLGVEKTFFDELCSIELRLPMVGGLAATQSLEAGAGLMGTDLGNVPLVFKTTLRKWDRAVLAAGVAVTLPTAQDARLVDASGLEQVRLQNDAVHIGPMLGFFWAPDDRWFVQGIAQADFDTRGNDVYMQTGNGLAQIGTLQDQSLLFMDLAIGRWVYRNPDAKWITGVAPTMELHYTTTMQDAKLVTGSATTRGGENQVIVGCLENRSDVLNLTGGIHFLIGSKSNLTVAGVVPLRNEDNRSFDAEFLVQFNRYF